MSVDPVILELRAQVVQYRNQLLATTTIVDRSLQQQERRVISLERQFERSSGAISSKLRLLAGTFAGAFSAREIGSLVDGFTRLQNSLRVAGIEGEALANVQERLRQIGATYGVEIEALGSVFNRASLAQKELGASTEQIIRLNEIIAAGLKITGTSSQEASGALLQLGQALGSGVVRAEEFNSVLEGALPIAQAAARGIAGFDGSVSKLRAAIADGQITSKQFFDGVLAGGVETIAQAEKATLTLGGALTVLRNELTLYVGEAAKSNGLTAALSSAITALARNLDTVATALSVIAAVLVGRYASAALASSASTGVLANALFLMQARAAGAATSMEVLSIAALKTRGAFLALVGGIPGLAIAAFTVAVGYAISETMEFNDSVRAMAGGLDDAEAKLEQARARAEKAGVAVNSLKKQTDAATTSIYGVAGALVDAARQAIAFGNSAKFAAIAAAQLRRVQALETAEKADRVLQTRSGIFGSANEFLQTNLQGLESTRVLEAARNNARATVKLVEEELALLAATPEKAFEEVAGGGGGGVTKKEKAKKERAKRDNTQRNLDRFDDDLAQLQAQELQLKSQLATDVGERAEYERQLIEFARDQFDAEINRRVRDKELTEQQAQKLRIGNRFNSLLQDDLRRREEENQRLDQRDAALRDEIRTAESAAELLTNREDRLAAEKRILSLVEQEERNLLERAIADGQVLDAARARANLAQQQANRQTGVDRQFESPLQRYRRESAEVGNNINDAIEGVAVDGLDALNDGIVDAITGAKSLGDAFGNVANQIIKDLLRIAIQRQVIGPLADSLFGPEGGGGGFLRSIFGRASGGYVAPGQMVRVNEAGSPGRVEGFRPVGGGTVIPLGQMNAQRSGASVVQQTFVLDARGGVTTVELIEQMNSLARDAAVQGAQGGRVLAAQDMSRMNRPRI